VPPRETAWPESLDAGTSTTCTFQNEIKSNQMKCEEEWLQAESALLPIPTVTRLCCFGVEIFEKYVVLLARLVHVLIHRTSRCGVHAG